MEDLYLALRVTNSNLSRKTMFWRRSGRSLADYAQFYAKFTWIEIHLGVSRMIFQGWQRTPRMINHDWFSQTSSPYISITLLWTSRLLVYNLQWSSCMSLSSKPFKGVPRVRICLPPAGHHGHAAWLISLRVTTVTSYEVVSKRERSCPRRPNNDPLTLFSSVFCTVIQCHPVVGCWSGILGR